MQLSYVNEIAYEMEHLKTWPSQLTMTF